MIIDIEGGGDADPPTNGLLGILAATYATTIDTILVAEGTTIDDSGTWPEGPHEDVVWAGALSAQVYSQSCVIKF